MLVGLADGDDRDIMVGQRLGQRLAGNDVERGKGDVGAGDQEFERDVGADVAGAGERQQTQGRSRRGGRAVVPSSVSSPWGGLEREQLCSARFFLN